MRGLQRRRIQRHNIQKSYKSGSEQQREGLGRKRAKRLKTFKNTEFELQCDSADTQRLLRTGGIAGNIQHFAQFVSESHDGHVLRLEQAKNAGLVFQQNNYNRLERPGRDDGTGGNLSQQQRDRLFGTGHLRRASQSAPSRRFQQLSDCYRAGTVRPIAAY